VPTAATPLTITSTVLRTPTSSVSTSATGTSRPSRGRSACGIYLDTRYPGIVRSCAEAVARVLPRNSVSVHGSRSCAIVQCYSRQWSCLLPQHGPGAKHQRRIELLAWQRAVTHEHPRDLVRGLLHSDGCRFMNRVGRYAYTRYEFSNRSEDIKAILCEHLDLLGIAWRRAGPVTISVARREAVATLDVFVGPKR
jgi:hypothetical protein